MKPEDHAEQFQRILDTLVQRGFVQAYAYEERTGASQVKTTAAGEQLTGQLRKLFDVTPTTARHLTHAEVSQTIMLLLLLPPSPPVSE